MPTNRKHAHNKQIGKSTNMQNTYIRKKATSKSNKHEQNKHKTSLSAKGNFLCLTIKKEGNHTSQACSYKTTSRPSNNQIRQTNKSNNSHTRQQINQL